MTSPDEEFERLARDHGWRADGPQQIGPDQARELMGLASLRYVAARLDGKRIAKYATLMLLGTWQPTPQPLPITEEARLVDGINRLAAIVLSGTTQTLAIEHVTGREPMPEFHTGPRVRDVKPLPEYGPLHPGL